MQWLRLPVILCSVRDKRNYENDVCFLFCEMALVFLEVKNTKAVNYCLNYPCFAF